MTKLIKLCCFQKDEGSLTTLYILGEKMVKIRTLVCQLSPPPGSWLSRHLASFGSCCPGLKKEAE